MERILFPTIIKIPIWNSPVKIFRYIAFHYWERRLYLNAAQGLAENVNIFNKIFFMVGIILIYHSKILACVQVYFAKQTNTYSNFSKLPKSYAPKNLLNNIYSKCKQPQMKVWSLSITLFTTSNFVFFGLSQNIGGSSAKAINEQNAVNPTGAYVRHQAHSTKGRARVCRNEEV